ncbi:unnamed protein product [Blepharisma stoltei]|uniref:Uncharacterized protein n=1 Tax=Blepharisma stoltei TaxID=1481888 RepID=A0AAU9JU01_9CILI|nr:unnamed protein product [Blepharisma stoltei]
MMDWKGAMTSAGGYWKPPKPKRSCWDLCFGGPEWIEEVPASSSVHQKEKQGKQYWTKEEDKKLIKLVGKLGYDWETISRKFSGKTAIQCSRRWNNKLDPSIKRTPWTADEDVVLKRLVLELGYNWDEIRKYLDGRSAHGVKHRFLSYIQPQLSREEIQAIERVNSGLATEENKENNNVSEYMDLDGGKDAELQRLNKLMEELHAVMLRTNEQISSLETEMYQPGIN